MKQRTTENSLGLPLGRRDHASRRGCAGIVVAAAGTSVDAGRAAETAGAGSLSGRGHTSIQALHGTRPCIACA